ncbi:hypothetical protein NDU88_001607 [Pleurodeles waltl]|uniref:Uncharacterized protein n=1 Tax=Pleurodeles waltl TaxID=8319 RepID=A0AAV7UV66_PLEWA|nr:hypothetical protein NDU88_001607 [Pleurodeles waltl]
MGDCSTPQPKPKGWSAAHLTADNVHDDEAPPTDQADQTAALALARQVRLEGRDSIVRFLRRMVTGSPEWGRKHARLHATEEEADCQTSTEEQTPAHSTNLPDISTDTDSPTGGTRAHRSHHAQCQHLAPTIWQFLTPPCTSRHGTCHP